MTSVSRIRIQLSCWLFLYQAPAHIWENPDFGQNTSGRGLSCVSLALREEPGPMVESEFPPWPCPSFLALLHDLLQLPSIAHCANLGMPASCLRRPRQAMSAKPTGPGCFSPKAVLAGSESSAKLTTTKSRRVLSSAVPLPLPTPISSPQQQDQASHTQKSHFLC